MAGLDIAQGILAGLSGLAQILNEGARRRQAEDLTAANLLRQTGDYTFEPITAVQSPGILGAIFGAQPGGVGGTNVVKIGNNFFELRPYKTPDVSALVTGGIRPADIASPPSSSGLSVPLFVASQPSGGIQISPPTTTIGQQQTITHPTEKPIFSSSTDNIKRVIVREAKNRGVDPAAALSVAQQESSFNPQASGDNGQSIGLFQLQEKAAIDAGINPQERKDSLKNIAAGVEYLRQGIANFGGDLKSALEKYYNRSGDPNYYANVMRHYEDNKRYVASLEKEWEKRAPSSQGQQTLALQAPPAITGFAGPGATPPPATVTPGQPSIVTSGPSAAAQVETLPSGQTTMPVTTGEPAATSPQEVQPLPRQEVINQRRVEAVTKNPSVSIVNTTYGPVTEELALQAIARNKVLQTLYPRGREGQTKLVEAIDKNWKDMVALSDKFFRLKEQSAEKYPHVGQAIRQARNLGELEGVLANKQSTIDLNMAAYAGILDASRIARERQDWSIVGQAMNHYRSYGASKETIEQARVDSGYAAIQEGEKAATVAKATTEPQAKAAGARKTAEVKAEQEATGGFKDQDEIREARTMETETGIPIDKFTPQMRATIRQRAITSKGTEAATVARAQEGQRVRGTDVFLQAADDVLAQAKQDGSLPKDATIKDLSPAQRDVAHDIEEKRQGLIKKATAAFVLDTPVVRREDLAGYINPVTGQRARIGMTPREIAKSGMIALPQKAQSTVDLRLEAKQHLRIQRLLAFGGEDTEGIVNGKPGEKIQGFLTTEPGIGARASDTVAMRLAALKQNERGRLVSVFDRNQQGFAGIIGRGMGADAGHFTENDRIFAAGMTGVTGLRGMKLTDARETMETQFRILDTTLDNALKRAVGDPANLQWSGMPEPTVRTSPQGTTQPLLQEPSEQRQERINQETQEYMEQERKRRQGK